MCVFISVTAAKLGTSLDKHLPHEEPPTAERFVKTQH